ncbi:trypsin-like [Colletes gigas]|uniref:trypsin-like n=1 Tax=Colletes gigas TaxID=935657 RepID=UPI001C9AD36C|nr:trypsin-like [Colletes gigas]
MALAIISLFALLAVSDAANTFTFIPRIIDGESVKLGEIPYQVSIQTNGSQYHFCGGSLLNTQYVLTAAHCVIDLAYPIQVVAGIVNLDSRLSSVRPVETIILHENYNSRDSWINDIALLKVKTPFVLNKNISPVPLPEANEDVPTMTQAIVSGWGDIHMGGPESRQLLKADLYISNQTACENVYKSIGYAVRDTQICANDPKVEKGSCNGDSGGPLTVDGKIIGIVSWSMACALTDYPTVYTRVSSYLDWIESHAV